MHCMTSCCDEWLLWHLHRDWGLSVLWHNTRTPACGACHVSVQHNCVDIVTCWMATLSTGGQKPASRAAARVLVTARHTAAARLHIINLSSDTQDSVLMLGQHADNVTLVFHTLLVACHYVKAHYIICQKQKALTHILMLIEVMSCIVVFLSNFSPLLSNNSLLLLFIINIHRIVCHWPLGWSMTLALFQLQANTPHSLTQIQMQTIRNIGILGSILYITCLLFTALT